MSVCNTYVPSLIRLNLVRFTVVAFLVLFLASCSALKKDFTTHPYVSATVQVQPGLTVALAIRVSVFTHNVFHGVL